MEMVLIKPNSNEWEFMWEWVANHPINKDIENPSVALNPENNECWQYMGSYAYNNITIHEFRHRAHPTTEQREYLKLYASENFNEQDVEKRLKFTMS